MARTAPVPNIPPIPGMCPSVAVMGGGGDGGGGSGRGSGGGDGGAGAGAGDGGEGATPDQRGAQSGSGACGGGGGCPGNHGGRSGGSASKGDPVDVVTGRVFTVPAIDLALPGPLPLELARAYSSGARERDVGLGPGWSHSLAWEIEVQRSRTRVWKHDGTAVDLEPLDAGEVGRAAVGRDGYLLVREAAGFVLDAGDDLIRVFAEADGPRRYRLSAVEDRHRNRIALGYRGGRLAEITDSVGRAIRVAWSPEGRIAALELKSAPAQGRWVEVARYAYTPEGDLASAADADGHVTHYTYEDHLLTAHAAPTGLTFHFRYDERARCVETWGDYGDRPDPALAAGAPALLADHLTPARGIYHCVLSYHDDGYSEAVDSVTVHRYFGNRFGKLDKAVTGGSVFSRTYDALGFLASYTDPLGATTQWERDGRGRELRIVDPLGRVTVIDRDPDGHIRQIIDPAGHATEVTRLSDGLLWTDPLGAAFEVRLDPRGLVRETAAPNGARARYRHDAEGNLVEEIDALGGATRLTWDPWGRCTSITDPAGATTAYAYSARGDLLSVRWPDGGVTRYTYDGAGNLTAETDPAGRTTTYRYGGLNRLCEVTRPNGDGISLRYDREGRLVEIRNALGEVHAFEHSAAGLVIGERTFDGREIRYRHDRAGRLARVVDGAGQATEFVRDLAGQIVERKHHDGAVDTFAYDLRGAVAACTTPAVEITYERNALGWVTRETQAEGGESFVIERSYDLMGRVVERRTSLGHAARWERDALGRAPRLLLDGAEPIQVSHDALGREVARLLPAGGRIETAYDAMGRVARRRVLGPARHVAVGAGEPDWIGPEAGRATVDLGYHYTAASELSEVWDQAHGARRFQHDPAGQLLAVIPEQARAALFRYDPAGNLHEAETGAPTRDYGPGDRLLRRGAAEYRWDRGGRLVEVSDAREAGERSTRYEWGADGLLRAVERPDGARVEFTYDAFARRMTKRVLAPEIPGAPPRLVASTRFVWDGDALVHEIRRAAGAAGDPVVEERTYCFADDGLAPWAHRDARIQGGERAEGLWFHYVNDHLDAPERLVGPDGRVACALERTPWGKAKAAPGAVTTTPLRYPGQYEDEETGLAYNHHRYYDPEAGRYISADPLGIFGDVNAYRYAANQPTALVDPSGLFPEATIQDGNRTHPGQSGAVPQRGSQDHDRAIEHAVGNARRSMGIVNRPNEGGHCAEVAALHRMAAQIRREGNQGRRGSGPNGRMTHADVRRELRERFRRGATISATHNGTGMAPCQFCAQVFRELGIHPDNIGDDAEGGVIGTNPGRREGEYQQGRPWTGELTQEGPSVYPKPTRGTNPSSTRPFRGM